MGNRTFLSDVMLNRSSDQPTAPGSSDRAVIPADPQFESIRRQIASLRFGVVQVVVHEGRIVQVDRTEKFRLDSLVQRNESTV